MGKLKKVEGNVVILKRAKDRGDQGRDGVDGKPGKNGKDGKDGKDGIAPTTDEILEALQRDSSLLTNISNLISEEIGKLPMGTFSGGAGFHVQDLPGWKGASANTAFGINSDGNLGFYDVGDIDVAEYTRLVDTAGVYKYVGEADPGTATSAATWRIKRVEFLAGDDIEIKWAAGVNTFTEIWDNRAGLSYS
jgi:hypothetical protein